jgi:hypothetical protein
VLWPRSRPLGLDTALAYICTGHLLLKLNLEKHRKQNSPQLVAFQLLKKTLIAKRRIEQKHLQN